MQRVKRPGISNDTKIGDNTFNADGSDAGPDAEPRVPIDADARIGEDKDTISDSSMRSTEIGIDAEPLFPIDAETDSHDAKLAVCGNGIVESGESCDGNCSTTCDDLEPCTEDTKTGSADTCDVVCKSDRITEPANNDKCCPEGANANNDNDCTPVCGNAVIETGEECDGGNTIDIDSCSAKCLIEAWGLIPCSRT